MPIERFPRLAHQPQEDDNPAIQMFGRRFYKDQTIIEYLAEFLLVFHSRKQVMGNDTSWDWENGFPERKVLKGWPDNTPLRYAPPARLILKLFAFLGSSTLETRHECHKEHFKWLIEQLQGRIETSHGLTRNQVLELLEQVLVGFTGVAKSRTWCTHAFLPLAPGFIAREAIWRNSAAAGSPEINWKEALDRSLFIFSNHDFMARGGEILYLQLCNLFSMLENEELDVFDREMKYLAASRFGLKERIVSGINGLFESTAGLDRLADWISRADPQTWKTLDVEPFRPATCGWCPTESWSEAYLFAYELANICDALIDPLEKLELLKLCCVLQVLRSLCAQSARHWEGLGEESRALGGKCGYAWIVTNPQSRDQVLKDAASRNLVRVQEMMHGAIRCQDIQLSAAYQAPGGYKNADEQAQELFVKLAKALELIVPFKGPNARFVLPEPLLRALVLMLIPPGERATLDSFNERLYRHFGIAVSGSHLSRAVRWTFPGQKFNLSSTEQGWFEERLRATGFLIPLSDAVSMVQNPFGEGNKSREVI